MQRFILLFTILVLISASVINISSPPSSIITTNDPTQCVIERCPTEYNACINNAMCPSTTTLCVQKCSADQNCLRTCVYDASLEPTFGVVACAFRFNCFDLVDPAKCVQENCPANFNACPSDPSCQPTLYQCYDKCKADSECWMECIARVRNYISLQLTNCTISNKCLVAQASSPIQCVQKQCQYFMSACQQDPKCEPTLYSCYDRCRDNEACWDQCLSGSTINQPAMGIANCGLTNGCFVLDDPISCIKQYCSDQYKACGKDTTCQPISQSCFGKCFNDKECWDYCLVGGVVQTAVAVKQCAFTNKCLSL